MKLARYTALHVTLLILLDKLDSKKGIQNAVPLAASKADILQINRGTKIAQGVQNRNGIGAAKNEQKKWMKKLSISGCD